MGKLHHIKKAIKQGKLTRDRACGVMRGKSGCYIVRPSYWSNSHRRFIRKHYDEVALSDNGSTDKGKD